MKFNKYIPTEPLRAYIKYFVVSEHEAQGDYKVFPSGGLVMGFQYKGRLSIIDGGEEKNLAPSGVTGISASYKIFRNFGKIGTILVFFNETGFMHFASHPANELANLSVSLEDIFDKGRVREAEEQLSVASTDRERINIVERLLLSQVRDIPTDKLIIEAVKLITETKGTIRIKELNAKLFISPSALEKRFRNVVGTTPKKFSSIIRFNAILERMSNTESLTEICYDNHFFDQAHFIRDFRQFTGQAPASFRRSS